MSKLLELLDAARGNTTVLSLTLVIWSIILGIIIALFITFYQKKIVGSFFRALIKAEAFDEDSAKTLAEIAQTENDAVISRLKRSSMFRRSVSIVNTNNTDNTDNAADATAQNKNAVIDEKTKFFVSPEQLIRIREQWGEKDENVGVLIGGVLGMIVLGLLVTIVIVLNFG